MHPFFDTPTPHLFGHRGASAHAPENTLPAFELACQAGVPYLETDCHATSDGEIVLLHDPEVNRTTDGEGPIGTLRFADVERLDAGFRFTPDDGRTFPFRGTGVRIPRLVEVIERFADARINLEVKSDLPAVAEEVVRIVRRTGATERTLLAAGENGVLEYIRKLDPGTALGSSLSDVVAFFQAVQKGEIDGYEPRGHALQIPPTFAGEELITPENVEAAHRVGLYVHVWTINDPAEIQTLLDRGADGIMSDDPATLVRVAGGRASSAGG